MKPFNLAEDRISERSFCKQHVNRRLKIMAGLIVLTAMIGVGSFGCKMSVAGRSTALKTQYAEIQTRCLRIKRDMGAVKVRSSERKWQEGLTKASGQWLGTLSSIIRCVPQDAWLAKLENSTQGQLLLVDGHAASYESLALFISRLRGISEFSEVRISATSVSATPEGAFVDFSVQIKLNAPPVDAGASPTAAQPAQTVPPAAQESQ